MQKVEFTKIVHVNFVKKENEVSLIGQSVDKPELTLLFKTGTLEKLVSYLQNYIETGKRYLSTLNVIEKSNFEQMKKLYQDVLLRISKSYPEIVIFLEQ